MVAPLRRVLLHHARDAFVDQATIDRTWASLRYQAPPDFDRAVADYDAFVDVLRACGVAVDVLSSPEELTLDALYVRDAAVVGPAGAVLCRMGKPERRGEPSAIGACLERLGVPVLGTVEAPGRLEGGDVVWLDDRTLAVGEGYRTNADGIRQLASLLGGAVETVLPVPLPHWDGPDGVLHLMSLLSPVADDLAVVYSRLLPVPFRRLLLERGVTLLDVPDDEFPTLGGNVLALAPRRVLLADGNPRTRTLLVRHGVDVHTYPAGEISRKGDGGPTCLTRPLWRG